MGTQDDFGVRINGIAHPVNIPGKTRTKQIIDTCARFEGTTIGGFVRHCINTYILQKYNIDITGLDEQFVERRKKEKYPIKPDEIIQAIIDGEY